MNFDDEVLRKMQDAARKQRPYAGFFNWPEREVAEWGVAKTLSDAAVDEPGFPLQDLRSRGPANDPPDCEARDSEGRAIAIEVTELVAGDMIASARRSQRVEWAIWDSARLRAKVQDRLADKDTKRLKGGPWAEYIVVIHTGEPGLAIDQVEAWLSGHCFDQPRQINRAYFLLSYDPARQGYPYLQLHW